MRKLLVLIWLVGCTTPNADAPDKAPAPSGAEPKVVEEAPPPYTLKGDLTELKAKGFLRILVPVQGEKLQRAGNPNAREQSLAKAFARKMGLKPVIIEIHDRNDLFKELDDGNGDLVAANLSITPDRQEKVAFTRPIRFVKQQLVAKADDTSITKLEDLDGREVVVRESTAYHGTLMLLQKDKLKKLTVKAPAEGEDVYALIQRVARGEIKYTVVDNDLVSDALSFEPNVKPVLDLTEKDPIAFALRKQNSQQLKNALDAFLTEAALTGLNTKAYKADLDEIEKQDVLRVLTRNSSTSYFLYRGEELGFEYELMADFAKSLGLRLELVIPPDREALLTYLAEGKGDLVAAGTTITEERKKSFDFTSPYNMVSELIILSASDAAKSLDDLKGKKISVRKSSSYYQTLVGLKDKHGFEIDVQPEDQETEDLIEQVGQGKLFATVADSNIVDVELTYNDKIKSLGPLGDAKEVGWMVRKDQPKLKAALDAYLKKNYRGMFYNMMVNKYFKNAKQMKVAGSNDRSDIEGQLSPFDAITKKYSKQYEFDWRLMTAQMYQESHFDPKAKSWVGALGLMQVMPTTAKELKIGGIEEPENGIHAGIKLMSRYAKIFSSPQVKEKDRIRFALAAYNCGPGHVFDAKRVAADMKLDPNRWFGNVEKAMLMLSKPEYAKKARYGYCRCEEPVNYVSHIQTRYDSYSKLVPIQ